MARDQQKAPLHAVRTKYSRYRLGGTTESNNNRLGWWERADLSPLSSYEDQTIEITPAFVGRSDVIADTYLGSPYFAWLVRLYNNIVDEEEELVVGRKIVLPAADRVRFGLSGVQQRRSHQKIT